MELAERAISLLEPQKDPQLDLIGRHLLAFWTNELGDSEEANAIFTTYRYMYDRFTGPFRTGRRLHLEANIARTAGDLRTAEGLFRQLVEIYTESNFDFD